MGARGKKRSKDHRKRQQGVLLGMRMYGEWGVKQKVGTQIGVGTWDNKKWERSTEKWDCEDCGERDNITRGILIEICRS